VRSWNTSNSVVRWFTMDGVSSQGSEVPAWRVMINRKGGGITSERRVGAVLFVETTRPVTFACLRCVSRRPFRSKSLAVVEDRLLCKGCGQLLAKASQDKPIT
jgi:hypothetical protein